MRSKLFLMILVMLFSCTKVKENNSSIYKCILIEYKNEYDSWKNLISVVEDQKISINNEYKEHNQYITQHEYDKKDSLIRTTVIRIIPPDSKDTVQIVYYTDSSKTNIFFYDFPVDTFSYNYFEKRIENQTEVCYTEEKEYSPDHKTVSLHKTKQYDEYDDNKRLKSRKIIDLSDNSAGYLMFSYKDENDTLIISCYDEDNRLQFFTQKFTFGNLLIEVNTYPLENVKDSLFYLNNQLIKEISLSEKNYTVRKYDYNKNGDLVFSEEQFFQ